MKLAHGMKLFTQQGCIYRSACLPFLAIPTLVNSSGGSGLGSKFETSVCDDNSIFTEGQRQRTVACAVDDQNPHTTASQVHRWLRHELLQAHSTRIEGTHAYRTSCGPWVVPVVELLTHTRVVWSRCWPRQPRALSSLGLEPPTPGQGF